MSNDFLNNLNINDLKDWFPVLASVGFTALIIIIILCLLPLILWIKQMVRVARKGRWGSFWIIFLLGLMFSIVGFFALGFFWGPLLAGLIGLFLGRGENEFYCGVCHTKLREEFLGGETFQEGKICRFCLEKKQITSRERERIRY